MSLGRWSIGVVAAVGMLAAAVAGATIWLLLTDPVRGADAVSVAVTSGDVAPFLEALGAVLLEALRSLVGYL